jgi:predicted small lipoprotein YifL
LGRLSPRALSRVAAVGALVAALSLAGCGRKGGLDAPPGATLIDPAAAAQPAPEIGPDGRPLPPTRGPDRTSPLDFLID